MRGNDVRNEKVVITHKTKSKEKLRKKKNINKILRDVFCI